MRQRVALLATIGLSILITYGPVGAAPEQPSTPPAVPSTATQPAPAQPVTTPPAPTVVTLTPPAAPPGGRIEPSPDQPLTLEESIQIALRNHGDVGA
ncbi:MAG: hypothetical protein M3347_12300, partial [Armatimonadota bacterium]|nr:hypothetical protein [Armatimonadota bacterium]